MSIASTLHEALDSEGGGDNMAVAEAIKAGIAKLDAPYASSYISTLGGKSRASVMATISLDPKEKWENNILENSRYAKFSINTGDKSMELISGHGTAKMRKARWKDAQDAIAKLQKWVKSNGQAESLDDALGLDEASDEAILDFLKTDQGKKKAANAIYAATGNDFRGKYQGVRTVTTMGRSGGTENWPVDGASAEDLLYLLKRSSKAQAKLKLGEDTEPTESELEDEYTAMVSALSEETGDPASLLEAMNGKISTFLTVFSSMLTQYDMLLIKGETRRGGRGNIYRLGLWFEALERAKARVASMLNDDSTDAIKALRAAIDKEFTSGNPGDKMRKAMDAYIEKGTLPKIPISKEVKAQIQAEKKAAKEAAARAKADKVTSGPEKITVGKGRPGQKFDYGDVSISTTLHDIGGSRTEDEDIVAGVGRLDELGGGRYSGGGRGGDPRWIEAKYAGQAKDGTSFRKGERVLYFPNTKSFFVGKQAEKEWKDFLSAKGDEEGMPYAESRMVEVFGKGDYEGEANAIQDFIAKHQKPGVWSLLIYPSGATKWGYSTTNPQGGGGGSREGSVKTAFAAGSRIGGKFANLQGDETLHVAILQRSGKVKTFETPVASPKLESFDSSALSGQLEEALSEPLHEEQQAHHFHDGKSWYVDTGFISASEKALPGFSLSHMGFGEFSLKGPEGEIEFDRMRGKDFPGQVGRSHKLYDNKDGALIKKLIAAMKGKSQEMKAESLDEADLSSSSSYQEIKKEAGKWAKEVAASLMKKISPKPKSIAVVNPDMGRPMASWDYRIHSKFDITLASGDTLSAFVSMNVADGECSGSVTLDDKWGGTITTARRDTRELATHSLVSDLAHHLSRGERTESLDEGEGGVAQDFAKAIKAALSKEDGVSGVKVAAKGGVTTVSGVMGDNSFAVILDPEERGGRFNIAVTVEKALVSSGFVPADGSTKWAIDAVNAVKRGVARHGRSSFTIGVAESLDEAQRGAAGFAFDDEDVATKPGAFKISSKALAIIKQALGDEWEGPESNLFKRYRDIVSNLSQQDLLDLFDAERMDLAQDMIAGKPKAAFNKWLMKTAKVSPALGKLVRARPDWASILFYMTVMRVSGRDMADIILKRYFETETDHIGAVKAKMKVEELEDALRSTRA